METQTTDRMHALLEAVAALTSELSLDVLLQRLVETAARLTGARYAALGVIDPSGTEVERFVTHGIDPETHAAIGQLPRGGGILGVLIRDAKPLRLHDIADHPQSIGFPPNHPPMRTFLGAPVILRGVAYGNLYLTEKTGGGDFTSEDEEFVVLLAGQAAVAIENARLFEASKRWSRQLESLNEVGTALGAETDRDRLLDLVVRRLRDLLDARLVAVLLPEGADRLRFAAIAGEGGRDLLGTTMRRSESKSGRVLDRGRSERVDSVLDDTEVNQQVSRVLGARTGLWVPLVTRGRTIGILDVHDKLSSRDGRFTDDDLRLAESFADRAAVAVDLSERVARDALEHVMAAQEQERRRLARELHDETGQALTSILLRLRGLEDELPGSEALASLRELVVGTLQDVRRLAVELRPKALDDFGLAPALERLTQSLRERSGLDVDFEAALGEQRLPPEVETALYRIVQESLTNVVKHAGASRVSVSVIRRAGSVSVVVEDDGAGFDPAAVGEGSYGLIGMRERIALLGGSIRVESSARAGTTLVAEVPLP